MPQVAIADTGSSAASLLNGLHAAANQQAAAQALAQQRQIVQDRQDQKDLFQAAQDGWIPADSLTAVPNSRAGAGVPTMINRSQASTSNQDPNRVQTIGGKRMYKPTDLEAGKAFMPTGTLADSLKTAGWDGKTPVTPEQSHGIMQALNEAQAQFKGEAFHVDTSGKFLDAQGKPMPVMIGDKTGTVRSLNLGGSAPPAAPSPGGGGAPGGAFDLTRGLTPSQPAAQTSAAQPGAASFKLPDKTAKAGKSLHFETHTNDKGDVTTLGYDPETMELKSTHVEKGIGPQRKDPADPNAPAKVKPPSPAQLRLVVSAKAKALKAANDAYTKAVAPVGGAGGISQSDQDLAEAGVAMRKAHQQAQLDYEESISALTGNEVPHNDWADKALVDAQIPQQKATGKTGIPTGKTGIPAAKPAAQPVAAPVQTPLATPKSATPAAQAITEGTIISDGKGNRQVLKAGKWTPIK